MATMRSCGSGGRHPAARLPFAHFRALVLRGSRCRSGLPWLREVVVWYSNRAAVSCRRAVQGNGAGLVRPVPGAPAALKPDLSEIAGPAAVGEGRVGVAWPVVGGGVQVEHCVEDASGGCARRVPARRDAPALMVGVGSAGMHEAAVPGRSHGSLRLRKTPKTGSCSPRRRKGISRDLSTRPT